MKIQTLICIFSAFALQMSAMATDELKGTITLSGAWALYPMAVKWAEEFKKLHPDLKIEISAGGAGKGIADALNGAADLGMVSRNLNPVEIQKGAWFVAVAKDAVVPVMNDKNPLLSEIIKKGIRQEKFKKIWLEDKEMSWGKY